MRRSRGRPVGGRATGVVLCALALVAGSGEGDAQEPGEDAVDATRSRPPEALVGRWEGAIHVLGSALEIVVRFARADDGFEGHIDIPAQGASDLPLQAISFDPPRVRFELPAGPGLAVWDGKLAGERIEGRFLQGPAEGTFALDRVAGADETEGDPSDAEPPAPPPYREAEVAFGEGTVRLAGTLTVPRGPGPFPAVVLISGSGPQDRDETLFGFRPFREIADHLSGSGIAVLRYDDRGVGGSTGDLSAATTDDLADDALAGVALLAGRPEVDPAAIGLLGHSEGAIVAPSAAARSARVAFLVLLAPPAVPGSEIIREQSRAIARAGGGDEASLARQEVFQRRLFAALRRGGDLEEVEAELREMTLDGIASLPAERRETVPDPGAYAAEQARRQLEGMRSRWFRHFLDHDPAVALREVGVPVLALFGERDLQVLPAQNAPALRSALDRAPTDDVTIDTVTGVNHLFQAAGTGHPAEYPTLEKAFVPGLLERIADWILSRTGPGPTSAGNPAPSP